MIERYEGVDGGRILMEAIRANRLVEHDVALAERLVRDGELVEYLTTSTLVIQGGHDRDLYLIVNGEANVYVNQRLVATRTVRESIGEMALIDPAATRSATVTAKSTVVALKISEPIFFAIASDFPRIFKPIAEVISERLRERSQFHRPPNKQPVLFFGSSVEGLNILDHILMGLKHAHITKVSWSHGIFGPSGIALDALAKQAEASDFAAFVFGPDDRIISREEEYAAPRDNVVFELGMFINELGRERTFIIHEHKANIKIPSDLLGITPITYVTDKDAPIESVLSTVCTELRDVATRLGPR